MRRGLVHTGAWCAATGAAVALSWFGVHTVLRETAYDPPQALPLSAGKTADAGRSEPTLPPSASSTRRARPSPTPSPPKTSKTSKSHRPAPPPPPSPTTSAEPSEGKVTGNVHSYTTAGGRVAFDIKADSATLVQAVPSSGWSMQSWEQTEWIRVDFTQGDSTWTVYATWNGHPPQVQTFKTGVSPSQP